MTLIERLVRIVVKTKPRSIPIIAVRSETRVMMSWQANGHSYVFNFDASNSDDVCDDIYSSAYSGSYSDEHADKAHQFVRRNFRRTSFQGRVQCYYEP